MFEITIRYIGGLVCDDALLLLTYFLIVVYIYRLLHSNCRAIDCFWRKQKQLHNVCFPRSTLAAVWR